MNLEIAVARWFTSLAVAGLVLAVALAVVLPLHIYLAIVVAWFVMLLALFARWSRSEIAPPIATARERGELRPYVAVKFPPWVERVARGWIVVFAVSLLTGAVLLVFAVVELRFRR